MKKNNIPYTAIGTIYETTDYSIFKNLYGNRKVKESNIKTLTQSMTNNGWVGGPIIVNEKMENIDGQNRLQAAENSNTPVKFMICPNYGIKECILLNRNSAPWNTTDYTISWAEQGYEPYQWLLKLKKKYPCFSLDDLSALCYNQSRSIRQCSCIRNYFRDGKLTVTDTEKTQVETVVKWLSKFESYIKKIGGRKFIIYNAILFCYYSASVDNDKLFKKVFEEHWQDIHVSTGIQEYLRQIDAWYNFNTKTVKNRIFVEAEFLNAKLSTQEYDY